MAAPDSPRTQIQVLTPSSPSTEKPLHPHTIFLAGPTDFPWRTDFLALLAPALSGDNASDSDSITVCDPFQPRWDSSWTTDYATDANFCAQTDWELACLESADTVVVYFDARVQAPVSMLELGLVARSRRAVVGCQRAFWKRGNVQAVCATLGVPLEEELEGLVARVVARVRGGGGGGGGEVVADSAVGAGS
ncbi:unnamed protein product [Discula destructiva]